jgi:hypothetical protein
MYPNKKEPSLRDLRCFCGVFIQRLVKFLILITRQYNHTSSQFGDTAYVVWCVIQTFFLRSESWN